MNGRETLALVSLMVRLGLYATGSIYILWQMQHASPFLGDMIWVLVWLLGFGAALFLEYRLAASKKGTLLGSLARGLLAIVGLFGLALASGGIWDQLVEIRLREAERLVDRDTQIQTFPGSQNEAGQGVRTIILFDATGEIERPLAERSQVWRDRARAVDYRLVRDGDFVLSVRKLKDHFYFIEIAAD